MKTGQAWLYACSDCCDQAAILSLYCLNTLLSSNIHPVTFTRPGLPLCPACNDVRGGSFQRLEVIFDQRSQVGGGILAHNLQETGCGSLLKGIAGGVLPESSEEGLVTDQGA